MTLNMNTLKKSAVILRLINYETNIFRPLSTINENIVEGERLKSWKEIPGPPSLPFLGPMLIFMPGGMLYKRNEELPDIFYKKYGPIVKLDSILGSAPMIFLYDPEAAINVFRNENWMPVRPGFQSLEYFRKVYNRRHAPSEESTGLLTEHGEAWRKFRTVVNPVLLQPKTVKLYTEVLTEVAKDMVKRMKSKRNEKNMIDAKFDEEMNLWALESIGVVALGGRLNCFDTNFSEESSVKEMIRSVQDTMMAAESLDFQPSPWRYITTPGFKKAMKNYEDQIKLSEYFINKAIQQLKVKKSTNEEKGVLEKLLEINREVAITMASDMLFAGVDTTSNTMIAILYQLAKNPEKQNKLREELISKEKRRPYLTACIKEAIRMMPVVGGNFRKLTKDYSVLGYRIPKDMFLVVANQYMCSMDKHFPRPTEFIPERWIVDKNDPLCYKNTHPFVYGPFGYGVRSCIGRRIAELEIDTFVTEVVKHFHIEWFGPPPKTRASTINYLMGPYNFIFKDV